jgi:hypothetical protein
MILEKQKQAKVLEVGQNNKSIGMSLDLDSAQVLMQMLSKNLYSDSIGSAVRECTSNALDSHRRAGVTKPIVVSLVINENRNYEFSVEDFGTGLDHNDVEKIISKYGKSTKRNSNTELGMMGLGFKAPLAYCSSFYFTCRKDGRERKYMMYEGEETNTIDLLNETVTDKSNGVKVTIPVKWADRHDFQRKIKEQLAYFENVYFNVDNIDNNFVIHRNKIFQFSEMSSDNQLHICLDDVYYPLDFNKMGIDIINIPVGLRFGLSDGLFPTPNRESLIYSQEAKKVIRNKLKDFANYMTEKYNETISGRDPNIKNVLNYYTQSHKYINMFEKRISYNQIKDFSTVDLNAPKIKNIQVLNLDTLPKTNFSFLLRDYVVKYKVEKGRMYKVNNYSWLQEVKWSSVLSDELYFRMDNPMKGVKKSWLRDIAMEKISSFNKYKLYYFKRKNSIKLGNNLSTGYDNYYKILQLQNYPKSQWRQVIKDWLKLEEMILENCKDFTDVPVPKEWIDDRKAKIANKSKVTKTANGTYKKLQGEIAFKEATDLLRYNSSRKCKFVNDKMDIKKMINSGITYIYDSHFNCLNIDSLYKVVKHLPVKLITFSSREMKLIDSKNMQNFIHYSEFMKGDHSYFKKISTSYSIMKLMNTYSSIFRNRKHMDDINSTIYKDMEELNSYSKKYLYADIDYTVLDAMLEITKKNNNAFDYKIYYLFDKYKSFFEKNYFIKYMFSSINYGNVNMFNRTCCDLFKYYKLRLNLKHYQSKEE